MPYRVPFVDAREHYRRYRPEFEAALLTTVANGLGVAILSTPKGVMSDTRAREENVGGEILCNVF